MTGVPEPLATVTLSGEHVRLERLAVDHVDGLVAAASNDRSTYDLTPVPDGAEEMREYVSALVADHAAGRALPFVQLVAATGEVAGCTRYFDPHWWRGRVEPDEIEIGGTWLGARAQRTGDRGDPSPARVARVA